LGRLIGVNKRVICENPQTGLPCLLCQLVVLLGIRQQDEKIEKQKRKQKAHIHPRHDFKGFIYMRAWGNSIPNRPPGNQIGLGLAMFLLVVRLHPHFSCTRNLATPPMPTPCC
jgi:hypothetical protein